MRRGGLSGKGSERRTGGRRDTWRYVENLMILIGGPGGHRIPDAFKAFCIIVSFTAANTSRIFVVSVACVRLPRHQIRSRAGLGNEDRVLWVNIEPSSICLHELEQDKLGSFIHVRSTNVLRTVAF